MALSPELLSAATQRRQELQDHAATGQHARQELRADHAEALQAIQRIVQAGQEIAEAAIDADVPVNIKLVDAQFQRHNSAKRMPFIRTRKDIPKIAGDGMVEVYEEGRKEGETKPKKRSVVEEGRLARDVSVTGWNILISTAHRSRHLGVVLTSEGRIGIFDTPKSPLERYDISRSDATLEENPHIVPLNTSVYANRAPGSEDGVFYLDKATYELPEFVDKIMLYDRDGRAYNGLDAIEVGLTSFIVGNDLDQ